MSAAAVASVTHAVARPAPHVDWPLISVVTPSFNQGRFLERCIRSVLAQNYPRFEHIVFDNCSTDGTRAVLRRYPHVDWISEPDHGQSDALNKAIRRSRGEIIAWINADDYYEPGAFAVAARELRRDTGVYVILGRIHVVEPSGCIIRTTRPEFRGHEQLLDIWSREHGLSQQGLLFRREVLERVGLLDPRLHYAMDYDLWLRITKHFSIKVVDEVLASFVLHPESKTGTSRYLSGFREEQERVSRRYWGPVCTRRYWRLHSACRRGVANALHHAVLHCHKHDATFDWRLLGGLVRRRPTALFDRHVLAVLSERLGLRPRRVTSMTEFCGRGAHVANGRVTVVIPTYNRATLLPRTIESVLRQTARADCDIVVVDDGSTDETPSIMRQFADQIAYVRQANAGVSAARNAGIRAKPNEFVAFLDSDDVWAPHKIARQLDVFRRFPDVVLVAANTARRDEAGREWSFNLPDIPLDQPCDMAPHLFERLFLLTSSVMVRSRALWRTPLFNPTLARAEDHLLWIQIACCGPGFYLSERLVTMGWQTPFSLSADRRASTLAELRVSRLVRRLLRQRPDCRPAWQRGMKRMLWELHDAAARRGAHGPAARYAFQALAVAPSAAKRWEWGRLARALLRSMSSR